ncbi:sodium:calcium antiporter, partial [bacterium]|nr:sodium:calcium antiporter [bacterium]
MLLGLLHSALGIVLLVGGATLLVKGSSKLADLLGVPPVLIGLTVVAWGTSAPEFFVSLAAALKGSS